MKPGVLYLVTSPSGRRYVGITTQRVEDRWAGHVRDAWAGGRTRLAVAIRKYGSAAFSLRVLLRADWAYLNWIEPRAIESYGTRSPSGYNLASGGQQALLHDSTKEKLRILNTGRRHTEATKQKMRAAARGRDMTAVRALALEHTKGIKRTSETRARMSEAAKIAWQRRKELAS